MLLKDRLFNVLLAVFFTVTVAALNGLGEERFDVYFSLFTLEYFVLYGLLRPRRKIREVLGPALFLVFLYFVYLRVLEVLGG